MLCDALDTCQREPNSRPHHPLHKVRLLQFDGCLTGSGWLGVRYNQSPADRCRPWRRGVGFRQLRTCRRTRPGQLCAITGCEQSQQRTIYSITSSAMASSPGGTVSPSLFTVFMLITSLKRVGCITGRSLGLSPRRMRAT